MHNELTQKDLELMRQELDYRRSVLRPKLIEDVQTARAFGDLSENFEYKAAKRDKNRNDSRCPRPIVTTMRQDALKGLISKESPVGRAVLGRRVGDRVTVQVNDSYSYDVIIRAIEPGEDTGEAPLVQF